MYRNFQRFEDLVYAIGAGFAVFLFMQVLNPMTTCGLISSKEATKLVGTQLYATRFRTDGRAFLMSKGRPIAHEISRETYSELRANGVSVLEGLDETVSITFGFLIAIAMFIYRECRSSANCSSLSVSKNHVSQAEIVQRIQIEEKLAHLFQWIDLTNYRVVRYIKRDFYN